MDKKEKQMSQEEAQKFIELFNNYINRLTPRNKERICQLLLNMDYRKAVEIMRMLEKESDAEA